MRRQKRSVQKHVHASNGLLIDEAVDEGRKSGGQPTSSVHAPPGPSPGNAEDQANGFLSPLPERLIEQLLLDLEELILTCNEKRAQPETKAPLLLGGELLRLLNYLYPKWCHLMSPLELGLHDLRVGLIRRALH